MLRIKLDRDVVTKAVEWHAENNQGLTPVIENDEELIAWFRYVVAGLAGYGHDEESEELQLEIAVTPDGEALTVATTEDVIEVLRMELL